MTFSRQILALLTLAALASIGNAAERFILTVPGSPGLSSRVIKSGQSLWIQHQGTVYTYQYAPHLNSADGVYLGYYCTAAGRAIRWPISDSGNLHKFTNSGWRYSAMRIRRVGSYGRTVRPQVPTVHVPVHAVTAPVHFTYPPAVTRRLPAVRSHRGLLFIQP